MTENKRMSGFDGYLAQMFWVLKTPGTAEKNIVMSGLDVWSNVKAYEGRTLIPVYYSREAQNYVSVPGAEPICTIKDGQLIPEAE